MDITTGAISPLLQKLNDLLVGEFTLEIRVRNSVHCLLAYLALVQAHLCKLTNVPPEQIDEGTKIWAEMARKLSYQMDDIINIFMVRVGYGGEPANSNNKVKKLLEKIIKLFKNDKDLHQISEALKEGASQAEQLLQLPQRCYQEEMEDTSAAASFGASVDPRIMAREIKLAIPMEITKGTIDTLLSKLNDLLNGEFTLEKRMRKSINSLMSELLRMHNNVRKVLKMPSEQLDEVVKIRARMVREFSYHMEDVVDAVVLHGEDGGDSSNPKNRVKKLLKKIIKIFKKEKIPHWVFDALEGAVDQAEHLAELP